MRFSTFIPAKIIYPDLSKFVSDDGKRFTNGYGPQFNELLDAIRVNATISKSYFGTCDDHNQCTDTLKLFQEQKGDFYKLPVPVLLLGNLEDVIKVGTTAYQLTHAMGSVTPTVNTTKKDVDLIDTVKADYYSVFVFIALPLIIYLINYFQQKYLTRRFKNSKSSNSERGAVVMNKLIRIILNQPNYIPKGDSMKIMIILYLLGTLFVLTVYRNIFGSDLTVTDSAINMDTIDQLNNSNRFVIYDPTKTTKQMIFDMKNDEISKLLQSKTVPVKSDYSMLQIDLVADALMNQEAVTITNLYYHKYMEGGVCNSVLNQGVIRSPASKYHISKETFFPTVTTYVYSKFINDELRDRLDFVLNVYLEYGIEDIQQAVKPRIAFKEVTGNDDAYFCTIKKETKEEMVPKQVSLKALRKTLQGSLFLFATSLFVLILEVLVYFVGKFYRKLKARKKKRPKMVLSTAKPEKYPKLLRRNNITGNWKECEVTRYVIK